MPNRRDRSLAAGSAAGVAAASTRPCAALADARAQLAAAVKDGDLVLQRRRRAAVVLVSLRLTDRINAGAHVAHRDTRDT
jgi:hypothetical protein